MIHERLSKFCVKTVFSRSVQHRTRAMAAAILCVSQSPMAHHHRSLHGYSLPSASVQHSSADYRIRCGTRLLGSHSCAMLRVISSYLCIIAASARILFLTQTRIIASSVASSKALLRVVKGAIYRYTSYLWAARICLICIFPSKKILTYKSSSNFPSTEFRYLDGKHRFVFVYHESLTQLTHVRTHTHTS